LIQNVLKINDRIAIGLDVNDKLLIKQYYVVNTDPMQDKKTFKEQMLINKNK
jgi:hypothetical protein